MGPVFYICSATYISENTDAEDGVFSEGNLGISGDAGFFEVGDWQGTQIYPKQWWKDFPNAIVCVRSPLRTAQPIIPYGTEDPKPVGDTPVAVASGSVVVDAPVDNLGGGAPTDSATVVVPEHKPDTGTPLDVAADPSQVDNTDGNASKGPTFVADPVDKPDGIVCKGSSIVSAPLGNPDGSASKGSSAFVVPVHKSTGIASASVEPPPVGPPEPSTVPITWGTLWSRTFSCGLPKDSEVSALAP